MRVENFSSSQYQPKINNKNNKNNICYQVNNFSSPNSAKYTSFGICFVPPLIVVQPSYDDDDERPTYHDHNILGKSFFHKNCYLGHYGEVKQDLKKYPLSANSKDDYGNRPIHDARKYSNIVELLLNDENIDVNAQNNYGETFLMRSMEENIEKTIKIGIKSERIDFSLKDKYNNGYSYYIGKIENEQLRIRAEKIMNARLEGKDPKEELRTDLHKACASGDEEKVIELMANPETNVNAEDFDGVRPIHEAVKYPRILKLFLNDERVDLAAVDDFENSAMDKSFKENKKSYFMLLTNRNYQKASRARRMGKY